MLAPDAKDPMKSEEVINAGTKNAEEQHDR